MIAKKRSISDMVTGFHLEKTEFSDIGPFLFCAAICCAAYLLVYVFM